MQEVTTEIPAGASRDRAPAFVVPNAAEPVARPSPLRANFGWTLAGHLVYAGCQWGILVVIARLAAPEAVGRFALGTAVTAPLFLLAGIHLRASQVTDAARRFTFSDYLGVNLAGMTAAFVATAILVLLSDYAWETRLVILAVGLAKAIEGICDVHYGLLQQNERMRPIAESVMWRGILSVAAVAAVLWAGGGLLLAVCTLAASWLAVLLAHDSVAAAGFVHSAAQGRLPRFRRAAFGRIVTTSAPLGVATMLVSLRTNIPRYFIEDRIGTADLGVFAALSSLVIGGNMVVSALAQSAHARLAREYHQGDFTAFRRLLARLLVVAGLLGGAGLLVTIVAGKPLLLLLFGPEYAARADVLVWLMAAGAVAYTASFVGYALTATRRFAIQLPLFAGSSLACAAACTWLVPRYGIVGAAWSWGLALVLELVVAIVILSFAVRTRLPPG